MDDSESAGRRTSRYPSLARAELLRRRSAVPAAIVCSLGIALSMAGYFFVRDHARQAERGRVERRALQLTSALRAGFLVPMEVLHSIPAFFDASESVARGEFQAFCRHALERWPEIYALEWFPWVRGEERERYEREASADGGPAAFQFTEVGPEGRMVRARDRPEHLPLYYMQPGNTIALGFDLASEAERIAPALQARDTGLPVMSPRIRLVEDPPSVYSIAVFSPVYAGARVPAGVDERRRDFRGVAAIVFRVSPVVERVVRSIDLEGAGFVLRDVEATADSALLYESRSGLYARLAVHPGGGALARQTIQVANRRWEVELESKAPELGGTALLAGGLSLSLLLGLTTASAIALRELRRNVRAALRLGQYTLMEKIGEGGMGVVYRARHALLSRPTAIKLLPPEVGEGRVQRFEREAQLTSELTHPNTIVVYDYGRTAAGTLYYVMEYLDGVTLEQLVRSEGPQPPARVVHLLVQVCGALGEAHSVGLIHRDVKPANMMLTRRGGVPDFVKVLDFGLVKRRSAADSAAVSGTHELLGTPGYWSPESILSPNRVDARSDIYSLGAVAYYLLTGALVFQGKTVVELAGQHLHTEPVPPSERSSHPIPRSLDDVVLRCLAKSPEARFQSAGELEQALLSCADVGIWSKADAEAWWNARMPRVGSPGEARTTEAPHTVLVDLASRRAAGG